MHPSGLRRTSWRYSFWVKETSILLLSSGTLKKIQYFHLLSKFPTLESQILKILNIPKCLTYSHYLNQGERSRIKRKCTSLSSSHKAGAFPPPHIMYISIFNHILKIYTTLNFNWYFRKQIIKFIY